MLIKRFQDHNASGCEAKYTNACQNQSKLS